ncbi:MAG: hypothetical protein OER86_08495, partial [Phycisphaerae bacterium]|nr:hypothetical protein [Phycisphaerae bacterium]
MKQLQAGVFVVCLIASVTCGAGAPKDSITKVMPPEKPHPSGTLLFAIFPREGVEWKEMTATAWEFIPDRAKKPLVRRCVFVKSTWSADTLSPESPDLIRLQVNDGPRPYSVRLYHIDYATWKVRTLYSGRQVGQMGRAGDRAYIRTSDGRRNYDIRSGKFEETDVTRVLAARGKNWLVEMHRKGERVVALIDPTTEEVKREYKDFPRSDWEFQLDPTGQHAVVKGPYTNKAGREIHSLPFGEPSVIGQSIFLYDLEQGTRKNLAARAIARGGSGIGVLPSGPEIAFAPGQLRFTNVPEDVAPGA